MPLPTGLALYAREGTGLLLFRLMQQVSARVDVPKGDYRDPMTVEEIEVKFNALADGAFTKSRCREIRDAVMSIDKSADASKLMPLLVADA